MKKNLFLILATCLLAIGLHAKLQKDKEMTANFYTVQWGKVEEMAKKDLPKSGQEEVNKILQQAIADSNVQQAIKASFYKNKYELEINSQNNTEIFSDFENLLAKTSNEADKSMLNFILGDLYLKYYQAFRWEIQAKTNLYDYVPEDMREWSQNIFFDKAVAHFNAALNNDSILQAISIDAYKDILTLNDDDSMNVYATLFDFIASKCIVSIEGLPNENLFTTLSTNPDLLKEIANTATFPSVQLDTNDKYNQFTALRYYQQLLKSLKNNNSTSAIIVTLLSKTNYLSTVYYPYQEKYYLNTLLELQKEYESEPTSIEVINRIVTYYSNNSYNNSEYKTDAYNWCKKGIADFPNYERIGILESLLAGIEAPFAKIDGEATFYPEAKNKRLTLTYKNLNKVTVNIEKKDANDKFAFYTKVELELPNPPMTFSEQTAKIELPLNEIGVYRISIEFDTKATKSKPQIIDISNIAVFCKNLSASEYEFYIVNRQTGAPIKNATISILKEGKTITSRQTDNKGFATYVANENFTDYSIRAKYEYQISEGNDKPNAKNQFPYNYRFNYEDNSPKNTQTEEIINLLTDRSIYRPGQVVYFKVIASQTVNKQPSLIVGKNYTVKLYDTNRQIVSEQTLKTNDFGSISGKFMLPQKGNTGNYYINIADKNVFIKVEEYKRPTFNITFDPLTKAYMFGDKITISGHVESFSGIKLQDAKVEYNITKSNFWRMSGGNNSVENGTAKTNSDGLFEITYTIPKEKNRNTPFWRNISRFNIDATVTDQNGETQSGNFNFSVGDVSIILSATLPAKIEKEGKSNFSIEANNLNGQAMDVKGTYQLSKIHDNDTIAVLKGNFESGTQEQLMREIKKQKSGKYLLKLIVKDEKERTVKNESEFVLYSISDKKPPIETNEWIIEKNKTFSSTQPAEIILGVSAKNATILYELLQGNKTVDRQQIKFSDENKKFVVPYKEEYGDRIDMVFTYMIDNQVYQRVVNIKKEQVANKLNLKFDVFRDKVRPGQHEEWRISVKDEKANPVVAELLASMYDVSLDEIYPTSNWRFDTGIYPDYVYLSLFQFRTNNLYDYFSFNRKQFKYPALNEEQLNWFGFNFRGSEFIVVGYGKQRRADVTGAVSSKLSNLVDLDLAESKPLSISADNADIDVSSVAPAPLTKSDNNSLQVRKNFDETAFFYPNLKTNERGETVISFTVPESNTTWKFRALAYDKELAWGTLEKTIVSRKELMVTPNLPRFMRQGDKTSISTKVSNLSENQLSGTVRIEFFDPITDKIVDWKTSNNKQSFTLDKEVSTSVEWMFDIPSGVEMIGCRIVAESDYFSDGEQHVIPILPNRMLVTESLPLNVNGITTKNFTFNSLKNNQSSSLSNYRLTLEYTSNPAWYAIQALPELSNPTNENAVNWFAAYYVNTLGAHIMKQYPAVSNMIDAWKKQGENEEAITSKLLKNEELKAVLLQETPWVLDAKNEAEQMQRIALLLNINNTKQQTQEAIQKLKELQNSDGGWSWYKGFASNCSMTQYILYGFAQLIELNAVEYTTEVKEMQIAALQFIDKQILNDFESLKKHDKNWVQIKGISTNQLEYLYVRSAYRDIPISQETREAERFYTSVIENNWKNLNLYERSLLVVLSKKNGDKALAENLIQSLRERATMSDDLGMYWANNKTRVFLSLSAVSTHVFIMNAFNEMGADTKEMNLMKQWLISQKQTQVWESTHASIDAIYALLSTGSNWFTTNNDNVKIKIAGKALISSRQELGTGYFQQAWSESEINKNMAQIEVSNTQDVPSYGAVYWQYFENLDKISAQKGALSIDKKLFVEKLINNQKQLVQITESNPLNVGDKVTVRLTVNADRDMEFVALKDMRAACFEPIETLSFTKWNMGAVYYQSTKDASTNFYFDHLVKGTYVFEYPVYVNRTGEYSNGISTIQCLYSPEFMSHTAGIKIVVK